ncbi:Sld3p KNAG_0F02380 [Huiozyma naganishii CBS 8797]|uniref:DNA replication regulator Sld3 C-terminal domain-containing protein n=1 Tax=Huiozyma naganishii (strain ATCC MYA-139 / BCRC 22969 / CBS 8797 / KCTC 17520 / NBRC 10181 / NCYC 3082 / Yp74L-3) TaxID=1071383 RepID=J7RMW2_HUIN7|nr:hypothetical protein KNAG_0F02380 [Kazachstania naganishii CBS 8797]CCK70903.1 hypothetical protein KNAG_0F02380 [Kazachstania naganishii CBS 8797]
MEEWVVIGMVSRLRNDVVASLANPKILQKQLLSNKTQRMLDESLFHSKYLLRDAQNDLYFLLEQYNPTFCLLYEISRVIAGNIHTVPNSRSSHSFVTEERRNYHNIEPSRLVKLWHEDLTVHNEMVLDELDMTPPNCIKPAKIERRYLPASDDPHNYIQAKYYDILFSFQTPLVYFVKSNLPRLKNMCKAAFGQPYVNHYQNLILELLLCIPKFDERYNKTAILTSDYVIDNKHGLVQRDDCLKKYGLNNVSENKDVFDDVIKLMKAREIKLQLILLLELIHINKLDTNFTNFEKVSKSRFKKRSINVMRGRGVPLTRKRKNKAKKKEEESKQNNYISEAVTDYCEQLDIYVDKLAIVELLIEAEVSSEQVATEDRTDLQELKKNIVTRSNEASSVGFTSYILVPYFNKAVPNTVKFIMKKFKGPSLTKRHIPEQQSSSQKLDSSLVTKSPPSVGSGLNPASRRNSTYSLSRKSSTASVLSLSSRPALERHVTLTSLTSDLLELNSTTSNLKEFLEAENQTIRNPSLLSRTKSDIVMNNLQKRQLPVTSVKGVPSKHSQHTSTTAASSNGRLSTAKAESSFRRVGKRKVVASNGIDPHASDQNVNVLEVIATPLKCNNVAQRKKNEYMLNSIVESPPNIQAGNVRHNSAEVQVTATPLTQTSQTQRRPSSHEIIASDQKEDTVPTDAISRNDSIQSKKKVRRRLFGP